MPLPYYTSIIFRQHLQIIKLSVNGSAMLCMHMIRLYICQAISLMKPRLLRFLLLVSVLVGAARLPLSAQEPCDEKLQILTWNVFLRPRHLFWPDAQVDRTHDIIETLRDQQFDVLVFQEAFDRKCVKILVNELKDLYPHAVLPERNNPINLTNGILILSKHPVSLVDRILFRDCAGYDCMADKGAVLVEFSKDGRQYQIVGTHAQAEVGRRFQQIRAEQYARIREELLEVHRTPGVPQIVVGDMNTECSEEADAYSDMLCRLDVVDGDVLLPEGDLIMGGEPYTWGCRKNDLIPDAYKGRTALLDYALLRSNGRIPKLVRRSLKVFKRPLRKSGSRRHLSDHYALAVTIGY